MITLITGTPGSSKTLNAIDLILNDPAFQERPVYFYNVTLLDPAKARGWQTIDLEQARQWYELPAGSVIVLDECQDLFPPEKFGNKVPEHIRQLNTHRHLGIDLVLITQHPKLIDIKVRRLVGQHFHFKRQFGLESATRFTFQECADDPNDYHAQKAATKTRKKFNKSLYGYYKSAEVHTHKRKIPWQLWGLLGLVVITGTLIYSVVSSFGQTGDSEQLSDASATETPTAPGQPAPQTLRTEERHLTRAEYLELWTPRIRGVPHSAPAYDEVYEVRDFPRPQCILSEARNTCDCFTQQATPLDIPDAQCRDIVAHGYWDPTREPASQDGKEQGGGGQPMRVSAHERNMRALEIRTETQELKF